jgi:hypothetical protein
VNPHETETCKILQVCAHVLRKSQIRNSLCLNYHAAEVRERTADRNDCFRPWIQPVDATSWLNRSAGVS